jgi:hypothetical protein
VLHSVLHPGCGLPGHFVRHADQGVAQSVDGRVEEGHVVEVGGREASPEEAAAVPDMGKAELGGGERAFRRHDELRVDKVHRLTTEKLRSVACALLEAFELMDEAFPGPVRGGDPPAGRDHADGDVEVGELGSERTKLRKQDEWRERAAVERA